MSLQLHYSVASQGTSASGMQSIPEASGILDKSSGFGITESVAGLDTHLAGQNTAEAPLW